MRDYIIIFVLCLMFSCWINGGYEPAPVPIGISGVTPERYGLKRDNFLIPEIQITSDSHLAGMPSGTDENSSSRKIDFSLGADNF